MFKGDWLRHPAIGVVVFALIGLGFPALNQYQGEASRADHSAKQQLQDRSESVSPMQPPQRDINPDRNEWREEQDLQAQQQMARWALAMAIVSVAGVIITAAGVFFVAETLGATREAAKFAADTLTEAKNATAAANRNITETTRLGTLQLEEARRATAAAEKSVAETRRIGEVQTRAYLSLQKIEFEIVEDDALRDLVTGERKVQTINLIFSLYNSGQPPARDVRIEAEAFAEMYQSPQNTKIMRQTMAIFPHRIGDVPAALACVQVIDARNPIVTNRMRPHGDEHWRIMRSKSPAESRRSTCSAMRSSFRSARN